MSGYIGTQPVPQATQTRDSFTATSGQTSFATGGYTPNFLDVYLNGVKLAAADYTATNGSDVVLASGAATGDILEVVAFTTFTPADLPSGTPSIDDNGDATAITITSDENILIGKTSTAFNTAGVNLTPFGSAEFTRDSVVMNVNRLSTDGDIQRFFKDGSNVGSIGIQSTGFYIDGEAGHAGIRFAGNEVSPRDNGSDADGVVSLGESDKRFKDAYLSGGVYLGGTGSANKLDDYEEGTWTPTVGGNAAYSVQSGSYTKVGNLVFIYGEMRISSMGTGTVNHISGLPFNGNQEHTINISKLVNSTTNVYYANLRTSASSLYLAYQNALDGTWTNNPSFLTTSTEIQFSGTYLTDA